MLDVGALFAVRTPPWQAPDEPAHVNYVRQLVEGQWPVIAPGDWDQPYLSQIVGAEFAPGLPVTAELTFYAIAFMVPIALISGVTSGWRANSRFDRGYRLAAFAATSVPPFILGLFLLSIFYVGLGWFPPGRTGIYELSMTTTDFRTITGFLTFDGLLNGRLDVVGDALRRLVLPVFTLSLLYWATISRVTRVAMIEEQTKDYLLTARATPMRCRWPPENSCG